MNDGQLSAYVIGIVIFTAIIGSALFMIGELYKNDMTSLEDDPYFQSVNASFYKINDIEDVSDNIKDNVMSAGAQEPENQGIISGMINTVWSTIRTMFNSLSFMDDAINALSKTWGFPSFIPKLILAGITIMIGFAIYGLIFNRTP